MYSMHQLQDLLRKEFPYPGTFNGRGIVTCAGGLFLPSAYVLVRSLRHHGCRLPIQIWHLGPRELPAQARTAFEPHGAVFVDCFEIMKIHPYRRIGGWESKPFAITHSPFEEVLFLDADNFALRDPEFLLDLPQYVENGSIFWPDFIAGPEDCWAIRPAAWKLLGLEPQNGAEIESGQLVMNKRRCWKSLRITMHMNENSDFYYSHCTHGDKDTFLLSWKLTGNKPFLITRRPQMTAEPVRIQFGPDDEPLFQHSKKWVVPPHNNRPLPGYELEGLALQWLSEFQTAVPQSSQWFAQVNNNAK